MGVVQEHRLRGARPHPVGSRVLATATGGAPASTPGYTGARHEPTTGNLDLHARQYDTTTGRFTRPGPAARDLTAPYVSAYAYADNVPSALTDPSGLSPDDPDNERVDDVGEALGIFKDAFVDVAKSPFVFLGDLKDTATGENGGAGAFIDKYLPVRPAYRLYRAETMLRQQGCDALADLYRLGLPQAGLCHPVELGVGADRVIGVVRPLQFEVHLAARERLQDGNPHPSDFDLLAHESYESNWMRQHGDQNYRRAHQATLDAGRTWDEHAPAADGIGFR
ncbi:RHS repeat-associated core domain-containing protein [Streptomyces sp. KN37]|uniref:RHS repeat-associated core domain-containing protein n=1 Tax=Streptomyces sp. KN37 TaxID=3090667 RepID=UPI002A74A84C|nr:RHS repeat-associated core domain-containing protein [Streptomyces sp. KN37]WPO76427.1 RHS repeat-associated core domain-containing protein [Streptomyces sp. KN37]